MATSLIDLFMTRILFRTGPDALSGVDTGSAFFLAVVGRINLTLEQFLLFAFVIAVSTRLLKQMQTFRRIMGLVLTTIMISSAALYTPLAAEQLWAVSVLLIFLSGVLVSLLAWDNYSRHRGVDQKLRLASTIFLVGLVLSFVFSFYYRMYFLLGAASIVLLPYPIEVYLAGVFAVIATTLAVFAYALLVPSPGFSLGPRNILKTMLLPSLLVGPVLYSFMTSFFATQIFGMVVTMSTDLAVSHDIIQALVFVFWFLMVGILLLVFKGRHSSDRMLVQQAIGLVFLLSTTMLFNYPYYLMLGMAGVIMICLPLPDVNNIDEKSAL